MGLFSKGSSAMYSSSSGFQEKGYGPKVSWAIPGALLMLVAYLLLGGAAFFALLQNKVMLYIVVAILALWIFRRIL